MANFDSAELALRVACPSNFLKYDDKEMPSIFVYIPKFRLCDVLSTSDTSIHPAFRVNGAEIDGFFCGKFLTSHFDGRGYSLPGKDPANASLDTFVSYNRAKGGNYHQITCAEWAAIALWCRKNGTEPKGNNNYGKHTSETTYKAIPSMDRDSSGRIQRVATGTGPLSWSHDGTPSGIWDLNGNVFEFCTGLRLVYGEVQIIADNNAAAPACDLSASSSAWMAIRASDGALVAPNGAGTTAGTVKMNYSGGWQFVSTISGTKGDYGCKFKVFSCDGTISDAAKLLLRSLALLPDADGTYGDDYMWISNSKSEVILSRSGGWSSGASSGLFGGMLADPRTYGGSSRGGRSAVYD